MRSFVRSAVVFVVLLLLVANDGSSSAAWIPKGWQKERLVPSFLIIGAQKGGTSSLYTWIIRHPLVEAPTTKELCYFSWLRFSKIRKERYEYTGVDEDDLPIYADQFPLRPTKITSEEARRFKMTLYDAVGETGGKYSLRNSLTTFEACPAYSQDLKSASRAKRVFPNMKAIFVVRNPADRIASAYKHGFHNNWYRGKVRKLTEKVMDASYFVGNVLPTISTEYPRIYKAYTNMADSVLKETPDEAFLDACNLTRVSTKYKIFCRRSVAPDICGATNWTTKSCRALAKYLHTNMNISINPDDIRRNEMKLSVSHIILQTKYIYAYEAWAKVYGSENVKVVISEDMYAEPYGVLNDVLRFVGLPPLQEEWLGSLRAVNTARDHVGGSSGIRKGEPRPLDMFHRVVLFHAFEKDNREFLKTIGYRGYPAAWSKSAIKNLPAAT